MTLGLLLHSLHTILYISFFCSHLVFIWFGMVWFAFAFSIRDAPRHRAGLHLRKGGVYKKGILYRGALKFLSLRLFTRIRFKILVGLSVEALDMLPLLISSVRVVCAVHSC